MYSLSRRNKRQVFLHFTQALSLIVMCVLIVSGQTANQAQSAHQFQAKPVSHQCRGRMMTGAQIAAVRGISINEFNQIVSSGRLTPEQICTVSPAVLKRAKEKAGNPRPDRPDEALRYRLLDLQDERGEIPDNGYETARRHVQGMKAVQRVAGEGPRLGGLVVDAEWALAAGIEPSQWRWIGPGNIGGRIRSVLIHPTSPSRMWVGSVAGGIWTTANGGTTWTPVNDFMANLAVTTLVIHPVNTNLLYAGTGEGFFNADAIRGAGIFRSTDGGVTWAQLPSTANSSFYFVNRLAISPNGGTLLAATNSGIFRSTDAGQTWLQETTTRTLDINFHPLNNTQAIAGRENGTAWYSVDGGNSWLQAPALGGARVEVAYARSDPRIVYASVENASGQIWRSIDSGRTYSLVNTGTNYLGGQGWYDNALWVDPTNPQVVIVGGVDLWRSSNGGTTLAKISQWQSAPTSAHADHHAIVEHPGYGVSNRTVFFVNDGGIYRANDVYTVTPLNGWQELNNNLGITQFYGAGGNPTTGTIVGGTQDNGTLRYNTSTGAQGWTTMFGGDGGFSAADPRASNYMYGEYVYLRIHRSTNSGASSSYIYNGITDAANQCANFIAPFILDPNNSLTLLGGGCSLWRSTNVRATTPTWTAIKPPITGNSRISAIAVARGNSNIVWVGHNNGDIYKTGNGTASAPSWTLVGSTLPNRKVTRITIDPNPNVVYVTFAGFSPDNVWRTLDGGATWTDVTGTGSTGLPDVPVRSLVIHPQNVNWLYAATEVGIFVSENRGSTWAVPHDGPANVSVDELFWMGTTLVAVTHGRGLFTVSVPVTAIAIASHNDGLTPTTGPLAGDNTDTALQSFNQLSDDQSVWYWSSSGLTGGDYGNGGDTILTTPALNLKDATTAALSYTLKSSIETGSDHFQVEVSTDDGVAWTTLMDGGQEGMKEPGWPLKRINLDAYAGLENVRIRFRITTNGNIANWSSAIDEIRVIKY